MIYDLKIRIKSAINILSNNSNSPSCYNSNITKTASFRGSPLSFSFSSSGLKRGTSLSLASSQTLKVDLYNPLRQTTQSPITASRSLHFTCLRSDLPT
ncbi:unnamed protein product, partial [Vitis vinifera]